MKFFKSKKISVLQLALGSPSGRGLFAISMVTLISGPFQICGVEASEPTPVSSPSPVVLIQDTNWRTKDVYSIQFSSKRESRSAAEKITYADGGIANIVGSDLMDSAHPLNFESFKQLQLITVPGAASFPESEFVARYKTFLEERVLLGISIQTLSRILDHEAMKQKVALPELNEIRVKYVLRSILLQHAINIKFLEDQALAKKSTEELYALLLGESKKQWIVKVGVDCESMIQLQDKNKQDCQPERFDFWGLPKTLNAFEGELAKKLKDSSRHSNLNKYDLHSIVYRQLVQVTKLNESALAKLGSKELYLELVKYAQGQAATHHVEPTVKFNINWQFSAADAGELQAQLRHQKNEVSWQPVSLFFEKLPNTLELFEAELREKLKESQIEMLRRQIFTVLLDQYNAHLEMRALFSTSGVYLKELFDAQRDTLFSFKTKTISLVEFEIPLSAQAGIRKSISDWLQLERAALNKRLVDLRESWKLDPLKKDWSANQIREEVLKVISQERMEFSGRFTNQIEILSKGAGVSAPWSQKKIVIQTNPAFQSKEEPVDTTADNQTNSASDYDLLLKAALQNTWAVDGQTLPVVEVQQGNTWHLVYVSELKSSDLQFVEFENEGVQKVLKIQAQNRFYGKVVRSLIEDLLLENRWVSLLPLCQDSKWPCLGHRVEANRSDLVEELIETLFPSIKADKSVGLPMAPVLGYDITLLEQVFKAKRTGLSPDTGKAQL